MITITPFSGWLLEEAVALDDECPGVTAHLMRASAERRQVIAAYLSRENCFRRFSSPADLGHFLLTARHNDILAAAFAEVPVGLRPALGRAGPTPHTKRYYQYLHAVHLSTARPEMAQLIRSLQKTGPTTLRIVRALPAGARTAKLALAVQNEGTARDLARLVRLMEKSGANGPAMLETLAKADTIDALREWVRRWAFRLNLPPHPVPAFANYTPICRADDLHKLALRFRNCARNYLADALEGKSAFAIVESGRHSAVAHLIFEREQWWLEDIYGSRNSVPDERLVKIARTHLAEHNVLSANHQPFVARKWSCLRRFLGNFDYGENWEAD